MVHGLGPWTGSIGWSMDQVHRVVHGPRSMFCIRPVTGVDVYCCCIGATLNLHTYCTGTGDN